MKKLFASVLFLVVLQYSFAAQVDRYRAETVAKNFYSQNNSAHPAAKLDLVYRTNSEANLAATNDNGTLFYVFNVNGNEGFVLVSGEDNVTPVLGYSTQAGFSATTINPSVRKWLEGYKEQIVSVRIKQLEGTSETQDLWRAYENNLNPHAASGRSVNTVNPLCSTQWNQEPYYNDACPYDNTYSANCVTGCVATAMAQVMKFWNFPTQGVGYHSYNEPHYGTQSANFGSTTYNWAGMPNSINSANANIATLMYHCGVSVDMTYGVGQTGGSSAYVVASQSPVQACAEYAYKTYFGYDATSVQGVVRSSYTDQAWIALLEAEHNAGRPVQYAGFGQGGGHTWVCDGYDANNFLHMNWGWGGNSDGFFDVNNLSPAALGTGGGTGNFNNGHQAVIGIKPPAGGGGGGTINQGGMKLYSAITVSANPLTLGGALTVTAQVGNYGTGSFTGDFVAGLFHSDGSFVSLLDSNLSQTIPASNFLTLTFNAAAVNQIPGTYLIAIFYRTGTNNYSKVDANTFANPVSILITGPATSFQVNSTITPSANPIVQNTSFNTTSSILNNGASNFTGWVVLALYDDTGGYIQTVSSLSNQTINAGASLNVSFPNSGLNVSPGTYYLAIFTTPDNTNFTIASNLTNPNPIKVTIVDKPINPDVYEPDNTENTAHQLPLNFSGGVANVSTTGSNMHVGNDYDYYKITVPAGVYTLYASLKDQYFNNASNVFTNDVQFSYKLGSGGTYTIPYDDAMPASVLLPTGGDVTFFVSDYYSGSVGTYELDIKVSQGDNTSINNVATNGATIKVYPNPAKDVVKVDLSSINNQACELRLFNTLGQEVYNSGSITATDVKTINTSTLPVGIYTLQVAGSQLFTQKIAINR